MSYVSCATKSYSQVETVLVLLRRGAIRGTIGGVGYDSWWGDGGGHSTGILKIGVEKSFCVVIGTMGIGIVDEGAWLDDKMKVSYL